MRVALYMTGIAILIIGLAVGYFTRNTLIPFNPTPVQLPIQVSAGYQAEARFTVGYGGVYQVEFDCENPKDLRPPQYSAWDASIENVDLHWEVVVGARKAAEGRSSAYPKNWYGRLGGSELRSGRVIGEFTADEGTKYSLRVRVLGGDPKLNLHAPRVNVKLNGQELSDLSNVEQFREFVHAKLPWVVGLGAAIVILAVVLQTVGKPPTAA